MKNIAPILLRIKQLDETIIRLEHIAELLEWDKETCLPPKAVADRAAQISLIRGMQHEKIVDKEWETLFTQLECSETGHSARVVSEVESAHVRECYRRWAKLIRIPPELIREMAYTASVSSAAWALARKEDNFSVFQPKLEQVLALKKEYAQIISSQNSNDDVYDALFDEYEPGANGRETEEVFDILEKGLKDILQKALNAPPADYSFLERSYSVEKQDVFGRRIQQSMGYDFERGRLDLSVHPFTATLGPCDVRVSTRYSETNVLSGLFSNIHEAGHGLYEQGFNPELSNSCLAEGAGLGIHESQSRFWENMVGRSLAFWERWYGEFQSLFSENLKDVDLDQFYRGINRVGPSLIRVDADEVTYCFHIIIRFRLERALIRGELRVSDLPEAWRTAYRDLLDIDVPNNADGCMQDIHWSEGLFGYFPTYALGNLYAAQFTHAMELETGPLATHIREGNNVPLEWLRVNIHRHGQIYPPGQLCQMITGESLNPQYFLDYLHRKMDV